MSEINVTCESSEEVRRREKIREEKIQNEVNSAIWKRITFKEAENIEVDTSKNYRVDKWVYLFDKEGKAVLKFDNNHDYKDKELMEIYKNVKEEDPQLTFF